MKKIILTAILGLSSILVNAQDYYHGLGIGANLGVFKSSYHEPSNSYNIIEGANIPGIMYKSTLAFEGRNNAFAISAYPFVGFYFSSDSPSFFGAELPIVGEYVIGDLDDQCFYFGGGFSASFLASDVTGGAILGPQAGVGGQFYIADRLIGLRASYTYGINRNRSASQNDPWLRESKTKFALGIYYMLGQ